MHVRTIILALLLGTAALAESAQQIDTAPVQMRELPRQYLLDGTVEAVNQSTVSAQTRGQVEQILFDIDDYVEQGALIAVLRDTEQKARLDQAAAELKEAGARLQEARQEHSRIKDIYEKQLVSQSAMDKAGAQLKAARARNQAAEAGLEQAREQYEYTRIRAPYSGIVTQRYIEVGETANPGQRLMSGLSLDQLRVSVDVPQSLIADVRRVGKASIQQPGNGFISAENLTIFPFAHQGSNTFQVRLDLPSGISGLFPGMFVKTAFIIGSDPQLVIPVQSVVYRSEVTGVYVVASDGTISLRHIRVGRTTEEDGIVVLSGLDEGEQVAIDPIAAGAALKAQLREMRNE